MVLLGKGSLHSDSGPMPRILPFALRYRTVLPGSIAVMAACSAGETAEPHFATWITEPEYQFGGASEAEVVLQRPFVWTDSPRDRVLVLDPPSSQVSVWTPGGSLNFVLGRKGEGPGDFASPQSLFVEADGSFSVLESGGSRITYYSVEGELEASVAGPGGRTGYQGFAIQLAWLRNGTHLGVPRLPFAYELGLRGDDPVDSQPLLRVRALAPGQWDDPEPLLWLDVRNRAHVLELADGHRLFSTQPFGDPDQVRFEPGTAVVVRTKGAPGVVELIEVSSDGDTLWHRRLQLEPQRLTAQLVTETLNKVAADLNEAIASVSRRQLRDMYSQGLYRPEHLPAADGRPVLTASGEVWLRTHEVADTLRTHYVIRRSDLNQQPRRVLLPVWLRVHDATSTHVWGIWRDSMDVPHVVGRRLVALEATD